MIQKEKIKIGAKIFGLTALLAVCVFTIGASCLDKLANQNGGDTNGSASNRNSSSQNQAQNNCQQLGLLTCLSPSVTGGSTCCAVFNNAAASVGYLCILGTDQFAGCYGSIEQARQLGCGGTLVRCTR